MASSPSFDSAKPCARRAAVAEIRFVAGVRRRRTKFGQLFLRHRYPSQRVARADAGHIALRRSRVSSVKWLPYAANQLSKEICNGMFHQPCDGSITLCCKSYFQSQACDHSAACNSERADVRLGSKADILCVHRCVTQQRSCEAKVDRVPNPINDQTSNAASKQKRTNKRSRCSTFAFGNYPWPLA